MNKKIRWHTQVLGYS